MPAKRVVDEDEIRQSVCLTGDPASSIGKILYDLYITRITSARAGYLDILNSDSKYILSTALTAPTVNSLVKFIASGGTTLGQPLPASTSLIDLLGNFTGPYNGAAQDDNVKASLDLAHIELDTINDDTKLQFVAAGSKTIAASAEKYLSIDSGTDGAEIVSITLKGVIGADWTIETYIPVVDAVATPAAGDKRDEDVYVNTDDKGGQMSNIGAIRYNMFLDITNDSAGSDDIDEVIVAYRSAGTLSLAWET